MTQRHCVSSILKETSSETSQEDDVEHYKEYDSSEYYDSDEDHYAIDSETSKLKVSFFLQI